jgi:histidyl-tRNA synthetase
MAQKIDNLPYKGCNDYFPEDFQKLQYIFTKWREVATKYGYREYLTPVIEKAEVYEAKSGEDIKKELYTFTDHGGRRLSLRPEMTPSVTRLVTRVYGQETKPMRLFSIANFFRGERPQKGRNREFWQLNADIFGDSSITADLEILMMAIDMLLVFNPPQDSFVLKLNNRKLIEYLFSEILKIDDLDLKVEVTRKMDKYTKLSREEFERELDQIGLDAKQVKNVVIWMTFTFDQLETEFADITQNQGYQELKFILNTLEKISYTKYVTYGADLIRGFDYYDGSIFEIFDQSGEFSKSLFGGGRYNGLAKIFGSENIPAVGFAPGDVATSIFLDTWKLWPNFKHEENTYYFPLLLEENIENALLLAQELRGKGVKIEMGTTTSNISKAFTYANKKGYNFMIILGTEELKNNLYKIKNMQTGKEEVVSL